jgi:ABC-type multidrug transport system ATPase subunit
MTDVDLGLRCTPDFGHPAPAGDLPPLMALGLTLVSGAGYAVQGVSFSVRAGELALLIGSPGSGQKTCMDLIAGRIRPTFGTVAVCGESVAQGMSALAVSDRPSAAADRTDLTGRQWLERRARTRARTSEEAGARVDATVQRMDLVRTADKPLAGLDLSGIRMLSMASALMTPTPVVALMEAVTDLNATREDAVLAAAVAVREAGAAVLVSATCGRIPRAHFDRVFVLHGGRLGYAGTGREVWTWASDLFSDLAGSADHNSERVVR